MQKSRSARSYRGQMSGMFPEPVKIEYVAPDRYRATIGKDMTSTIIGQDSYMTMAGQTRHSKGDQVMPDLIAQGEAALDKSDVQALGEQLIDGQQADGYQLSFKDPAPGQSRLWFSKKTGFLIRLDTSTTVMGKTVEMKATYTDFNDPSITIEAPAVR